jgi:hypothetical protein
LNVGLEGPVYQSIQPAVLVKSPDVGLLMKFLNQNG